MRVFALILRVVLPICVVFVLLDLNQTAKGLISANKQLRIELQQCHKSKQD